MAFSITLQPGNNSFPAEAGETILDAALKHGQTIPFSCRDGACGMCKGRVLQGSVDHGKFQEFALSATERAAGMTLFCCAKPKSNLVIERLQMSAPFGMPPMSMPPAWTAPASAEAPSKTMPCRVEKMELVAEDVMVLYLKLPPSEPMQFLAGQYINILTEDGRQHSFSLGNAPHDNKFLQLHIRMIPGGDFTHHVFTQMKELDILRISGPFGAFVLHEDSAKPIIFIAGGTGIAPVKAIIEHALHDGIDRDMHLYWGVRKRADLYLLDLAKQWQARGILFTPVLSEPLAEDNWRGKTGFAHQAVMENYSDLSGHQVYASGGPVMVESAYRDLTTLLRLPKEEFLTDSFTHEPKM